MEERQSHEGSDLPSREYDDATATAILDTILREVAREDARFDITERKAATLIGLCGTALGIFLGFLATRAAEVEALPLITRLLIVAILILLPLGIVQMVRSLAIRPFVTIKARYIIREQELGLSRARIKYRHAVAYQRALEINRYGPMIDKERRVTRGIELIGVAFLLVIPLLLSIALSAWVGLVGLVVCLIARFWGELHEVWDGSSEPRDGDISNPQRKDHDHETGPEARC